MSPLYPFVDAFGLPFMATALAALAMLAVVVAPVSTLVSLRGLEFLSDGLTHAVFPGLVIGYAVAQLPGLYAGAVIAAVAAAIVLTLLTRRGVANDSAIAIVLTAMFGLGVVVVSRQGDYFGQLQALLFGRLFAVSPAELIPLAATLSAAFVLIVVTWRQQLFRAFDPDGARAVGYSPFATDLALTVAIALIVVAASTAVGNLLVLAVLVIPGGVGRLLSRRFAGVVAWSTAFLLLSAWIGLAVAFALSLSTQVRLPGGATVVLTMVAGYLLAVAWRLGADAVVRARARYRLRDSGPGRRRPRPEGAGG